LDFTESRLRIESALADPEFRKWFKRIGMVLAVPAGLGLLLLGYFWFTLPPLSQLERIAPSLITRMYDKDSTLIREFYTERRVWIPVAKVPERQIKAVLAIEDQGFYRHGGIDMWAIPAAMLPAITGKRVRGASTLTQQLTKLVFLGPERSLSRKFREILLAIRIERTYTKNEILEFYLNEVYLGAGAYGFSAAAERYFSRTLDKLTLGQQALMAGLLQRPETLRPDKHPANALSRRNTVLRAMASNGAITRAEMEAAIALPLEVKMKAFEQVAGDEAAYFVETVRKELEGRWGKGFLDSAGTRIRTTLDRRAQALADSTLAEHLASIQERMNVATMLDLGMQGRLRRSQDEILRNWDLMYARFDSLFLRKDTTATRRFPEHARYHKAQGAVVVIENATGAVRALSGGLDFKESNYNRATMAARSPGSAFKPIVYAAAIDKGASPGARLVDKPFSMPDPDDTTKQWRPHNLEYDYEGGMTMRRAFYRSRNIPAIQVALSTGLDTVSAYALRFGISRPLRPVPAMALGACDASPLEMASAFSVFPNGGEWVRPRFVESILDRNGSSLPLGDLGGELGGEPGGGSSRRRVMSEPGAWIMTGMLRDVNIRGTAAEVWASGFYHPSGGKTGTSNDYRDAWFIGFTKRYTTAVWVGTDDHASLGAGHTGTDDAMPIWLDLMRGLHRGMKVREFDKDFPRPAGVIDVRLCRLTGRTAQGFCDSVATDFKVAGVGEKPGPCRSEMHIGQDPAGAVEGQSAAGGGSPGGKGGSFLEGFLRKFKSL
jgi:penicillin-binding protein 1A